MRKCWLVCRANRLPFNSRPLGTLGLVCAGLPLEPGTRTRNNETPLWKRA